MMRKETYIGLDAAARGRQQGQEALYMCETAWQAIEETRQLLDQLGRQLSAFGGEPE